ncbi:MAG TPA: ABC transporter permease [Clostridium sp.]|uniref:FtsX-like permease family protein n=2 Tax=Acetivibrio mesophilus TaxID=2487273 RepID=A0A4Q0I8P0_9FIRM|nr:FtsX-like permease family protein [Acetivibrio mesophilus]HHV30347.1 ABC transporter permease [Clostridium sp.]
MNENALTPAYYVQFQKDAGASKRIEEIKEQYELTDNSIERNKAILDITGINDDSAMQPFYLAAAILFLLVLIAGVLMIASSMNSDIAQRTQFFGMMRCIGMSKRQILHFVRLEALNWCKTAVPIGLALGVVSTWGLCAVMRYGVGEEFLYMPLFKISAVGIISGAVTGIVTVFIAAKSPAKQASKVSPVSAVSGNAVKARGVHRAVNIPFKKIETSLGIQRALSAKKNLLLMTGSFALSIILFLSFSVLIELVNYLMPQKANYSDIEIYSVDNINSLDSTLIHKISDMDGVKEVFGRRSIFDIPAELLSNTISADTVDLISFDEFDLDCLTKDKELRKGSDISKVYGNSNYVISIHDKEGSLKIGDKVRIGDEELEVAGLLRYDIFTNDGSTDGRVTLITSGETFTRLTNVSDYSLISIQLTKDVTDGDVEAIRSLLGDECKFRDYRDQRTIGTYTAFVVLVYAFVVLIALVAILNIVNSISMSVSARIKQYGVMRAIGADKHQVMRMITAEASTYAFSGFVIGCVVGVPLSKLMYDKLITAHFSYATWNVPVQSLLIILIFIILSTIAAVYVPSKRMSNMPITEIISEL